MKRRNYVNGMTQCSDSFGNRSDEWSRRIALESRVRAGDHENFHWTCMDHSIVLEARRTGGVKGSLVPGEKFTDDRIHFFWKFAPEAMSAVRQNHKFRSCNPGG